MRESYLTQYSPVWKSCSVSSCGSWSQNWVAGFWVTSDVGLQKLVGGKFWTKTTGDKGLLLFSAPVTGLLIISDVNTCYYVQGHCIELYRLLWYNGMLCRCHQWFYRSQPLDWSPLYCLSRNYPRNQNPAHHCLSATCLPQKDFLQSSYYLGVCSNMVCAMFVFVFVPIYEFKVKKYNFNLISQNKIVFFEFEFINRDIIPISADFMNFSLLLLQHQLQFAHIGPSSGLVHE